MNTKNHYHVILASPRYTEPVDFLFEERTPAEVKFASLKNEHSTDYSEIAISTNSYVELADKTTIVLDVCKGGCLDHIFNGDPKELVETNWSKIVEKRKAEVAEREKIRAMFDASLPRTKSWFEILIEDIKDWWTINGHF